ncbi:Trp biosynthesis-associated membrane protein [Blastococcus sp. TF02A-26]|uniref:Trp biosynthesis-associated membrane protein n=1 Tax=Blastococcus sp. TF02A-26 TaxID=2250577 RepID=UPI000DEA3EBD|nr:Trp biosynthesis-associated membrane protein [Blastococcus sp. TF02A-26]RBY88363.1 TIGR02234 family membrane protein [Blastococcus sp. TF02A-26]
MTGSRRELGAAVAGLAVAGGLALSAGGQTWATATVTRQAPLPPIAEELTGTDLAALVPACGLLLLAAAVAVIAVRGRGRQLVGLLACVGGGTLLWSGLRALLHDPGLADLSDGTAAAATALTISRSVAWPVLAVLAGVLGAAAGGLAVLRGAGWQGMGRRYERTATAAPAAAGTREDRALDAWRALDRGEDPTADPTADPPADPTAPPPGGVGDRL